MPFVFVCSELIHTMTCTEVASSFVNSVDAAEKALRDATSAFYSLWERQPISEVETAEYAKGEDEIRQLKERLNRLQSVVPDSSDDENSENDDDDDDNDSCGISTKEKMDELLAAKRELEEVSLHHHSRFQAQAFEYGDRLCYARGQVRIRNLKRKVRRLRGKVVSEDESSDCSVSHSDDEADDDAAAAEVDIYVAQDPPAAPTSVMQLNSGTKRPVFVCTTEELDGELYFVKRQCV